MVGVLTSWDAGVLCVVRRTGEAVRIDEAALVAGKTVPAAPARRRGPAASARELDLVAARGWPPVESEPLGGWRLRAARYGIPGEADAPDGTGVTGFTRRANSVLPLDDPGMPLDEALAAVTTWYAERRLPAYIQVSTGAEGTQEPLAAQLAERGWHREVAAQVRIAALAPLADPEPAALPRVTLARTPDDAWMRRYQRFEHPAPEVLKVLAGGPSVWFATVRDEAGGAVPAAIGRCVVDGRWAGFAAIEVDPRRRRQGLATAVMTALARKALDEGASAAYLQVETDNEGAHALYDGMGFTVHHTYHHWRAPGEERG